MTGVNIFSYIIDLVRCWFIQHSILFQCPTTKFFHCYAPAASSEKPVSHQGKTRHRTGRWHLYFLKHGYPSIRENFQQWSPLASTGFAKLFQCYSLLFFVLHLWKNLYLRSGYCGIPDGLEALQLLEVLPPTPWPCTASCRCSPPSPRQ